MQPIFDVSQSYYFLYKYQKKGKKNGDAQVSDIPISVLFYALQMYE